MVKNALVEILIDWKNLSDVQKIKKLQELENSLAKFQGRHARTIVLSDSNFSDINQNYYASAYYDRETGENIYVLNLEEVAINNALNIIHEGFHAYIDDFLSGKVKNLTLLSKVNLERFFMEEENLPQIYNEFYDGQMSPLFDRFFIEERLNFTESSLYFLKYLLDSVENKKDIEELNNFMLFAVDYSGMNEIDGKTYESRYGLTYDDVVINALNKENIKQIKIDKTGKCNQAYDVGLLKLYETLIKYHKNVVNSLDSLFISDDEKEKIANANILKMTENYQNYALNMLKEKVKI